MVFVMRINQTRDGKICKIPEKTNEKQLANNEKCDMIK